VRTERQLCVENHSKVAHRTGWLDRRTADNDNKDKYADVSDGDDCNGYDDTSSYTTRCSHSERGAIVEGCHTLICTCGYAGCGSAAAAVTRPPQLAPVVIDQSTIAGNTPSILLW